LVILCLVAERLRSETKQRRPSWLTMFTRTGGVGGTGDQHRDRRNLDRKRATGNHDPTALLRSKRFRRIKCRDTFDLGCNARGFFFLLAKA